MNDYLKKLEILFYLNDGGFIRRCSFGYATNYVLLDKNKKFIGLVSYSDFIYFQRIGLEKVEESDNLYYSFFQLIGL